jgi:hypothetical protein
LVNAASSDPYDNTVERNSAARPFHADAVATIGPEPAPEYIRAELTSGGNIAKSSIAVMVTPLKRAVMVLVASVAAYDPAPAWTLNYVAVKADSSSAAAEGRTAPPNTGRRWNLAHTVKGSAIQDFPG